MCICDDGGTACGANCCAVGQVCREGQCAAPEPPACIPAGEPCKDSGRVCCDGRTCASGQGGSTDIGCHVPAGGACATTADCVYDATCQDGACVANPQPDQPTPTSCASSFPVSDDVVANGIALAAAWNAAKTTSGTVITLAPGTYAVPAASSPGYDPGLEWVSGDVTLLACAGGAVNLTFTNKILMHVKGGSVTLTGLTLTGSGPDTVHGVIAQTPGTVALTDCTASGFNGAGGGFAVLAFGATVAISGGRYVGNGNPSQSFPNLSGGVFTCSGSPTADVCSGLGAACVPCNCTICG